MPPRLLFIRQFTGSLCYLRAKSRFQWNTLRTIFKLVSVLLWVSMQIVLSLVLAPLRASAHCLVCKHRPFFFFFSINLVVDSQVINIDLAFHKVIYPEFIWPLRSLGGMTPLITHLHSVFLWPAESQRSSLEVNRLRVGISCRLITKHCTRSGSLTFLKEFSKNLERHGGRKWTWGHIL